MDYYCFDFRIETFNNGNNFTKISFILSELEYSYVVFTINDTQTINSLKDLIINLHDIGIECYFMLLTDMGNKLDLNTRKRFIIGIEGGTKKRNLKIINNYNFDVLINPSKDVKLKDFMHNVSSGIDTKLLNALKNKCLFFAIPYSRIFEFNGYSQSLIIRQIIQELRLLEKYNVPTILSFSSNNLYCLRDPEDLLIFLEVFSKDFNISEEWIEKLLTYYPSKLIELKDMILPGIKILDMGECY